jgi:preprotein translocase subunit YajC
MLDLLHLIIPSALAQDAAAAPPPAPAGPIALMQYLPFVLIFGVFYILVIRPQQKKLDEQSKMVKALQRGDRIVTNSGIHGKISKIESDTIVMVEIADGISVKMDRSAVQGLEAKTEPVAAVSNEDK